MSHPTSPDLDIVNATGSLPELFECVRELIAVLDTEGTILFANSALREVLGHSPSAVTGKPISEFIHEDYLDLFQAVLSRLGATMETKVNMRCRLRHQDAGWRWFDAEARRHPGQGEAGIVVSLLEITDLQRMEAERQVIFEVIHALNQTSNLDQLLRHIHQSLKKVLYAENCFIAMHDAERESFHFPFFADRFDSAPAPQKVASTCMAYVFRTGNSC